MITRKILYLFAVFTVVLVSASCASLKVSPLSVANKASHPVRAIAMAPEGGLLAEAVGIELSNFGYTIIDSSSTANLLVRMNMDELEVATPQGLEKLKNKGIDAYLIVKGAAADNGLLLSASARASSTHSGQIITGISWHWGGQKGSIAERTVEMSLAEAAHEIAESLVLSLPQQ